MSLGAFNFISSASNSKNPPNPLYPIDANRHSPYQGKMPEMHYLVKSLESLVERMEASVKEVGKK
jgi:hypothetical protein